jgi:hypothetical protein
LICYFISNPFLTSKRERLLIQKNSRFGGFNKKGSGSCRAVEHITLKIAVAIEKLLYKFFQIQFRQFYISLFTGPYKEWWQNELLFTNILSFFKIMEKIRGQHNRLVKREQRSRVVSRKRPISCDSFLGSSSRFSCSSKLSVPHISGRPSLNFFGGLKVYSLFIFDILCISINNITISVFISQILKNKI